MRLTLWLRRKARADHGATAVEYAIMVAMIAIGIVTMVAALGTEVSAMFVDITAGL